MQEPPHPAGRDSPDLLPGPRGREPDRAAEGKDRPHTPSQLHLPAVARAQSGSRSEPRLPRRQSAEFDLSSVPISPTRPKSPWGPFDPYNNNEVTRGRDWTSCVCVCVVEFRCGGRVVVDAQTEL